MDPSGADARSGRLSLEKATVECRWIGDRRPDRPEIVLLHEGLGSVSSWRDFPEKVSKATGCAVFAYSRPGYGCSEPFAVGHDIDYMHREAQEILPQVLTAAGIEHPILFGHSDGGSIALLYAAAHPDGPSALILEAPHVFVEEVTLSSVAAARAAFATGGLQDRLARHHADAEATFRRWSEIWLSPDFRSWSIEGELHRVRCPILLIQALDDSYGTLAQLEAIVAATPAADRLILPVGGHAPHRAEPDRVVERCTEFVAECARRHLDLGCKSQACDLRRRAAN